MLLDTHCHFDITQTMNSKAAGWILLALGVLFFAGAYLFFPAGLLLGPLFIAAGLYFIAVAWLGKVPKLSLVPLVLLGLEGIFTFVLKLVYRFGGYAAIANRLATTPPDKLAAMEMPVFLQFYYTWDNYILGVSAALVILFCLSLIFARRRDNLTANPPA